MSNEAVKPQPDQQQQPNVLVDTKTIAPAVQPGVMSAFAAAEMWGTWYGARPSSSRRKYRPPYSIHD